MSVSLSLSTACSLTPPLLLPILLLEVLECVALEVPWSGCAWIDWVACGLYVDSIGFSCPLVQIGTIFLGGGKSSMFLEN